jgi:hypothetical protein
MQCSRSCSRSGFTVWRVADLSENGSIPDGSFQPGRGSAPQETFANFLWEVCSAGILIDRALQARLDKLLLPVYPSGLLPVCDCP